MSEVYTQDDNAVEIDHVGRYEWRLRCSCGQFRTRARSESEATEKAMAHVLEHDIAYEEALSS